MTHFTLTVVTSADGLIARAHDDAPQTWASREEQTLFFRDVEAADWAIMGRHTHEAADKPNRHRIVFSTKKQGWHRPTQLWFDPADLRPGDFADRVRDVRPLDNGLILGGTAVHGWFLDHAAIHRVHLTVEPVYFREGLPVFPGGGAGDPLAIFSNKGFRVRSSEALNAGGTVYHVLEPW